MKIFIRADASNLIGSGHVMRCLALAQAWHNHGGEITFAIHCESVQLKQKILDEGCRLMVIQQPAPDPSDLQILIKTARRGDNDWFVIDGYHFTSDYQEALYETGAKLLVIDDCNHLPSYHADIILNQNIFAEDLQYVCGKDTARLLGVHFSLIRRDFLGKNKKSSISESATKILVTLGGADPDNATSQVIKALQLLECKKELEADIVVGPHNPHRKKLETEVDEWSAKRGCDKVKMNLLYAPPHLPDLMASADMAISAGGSTCWELAFLGVPFIVGILADNQKKTAYGLGEAGAALNCGWFHEVDVMELTEYISRMITDRRMRQKLSNMGRQLVDGQGVERVINAMEIL